MILVAKITNVDEWITDSDRFDTIQSDSIENFLESTTNVGENGKK